MRYLHNNIGWGAFSNARELAVMVLGPAAATRKSFVIGLNRYRVLKRSGVGRGGRARIPHVSLSLSIRTRAWLCPPK